MFSLLLFSPSVIKFLFISISLNLSDLATCGQIKQCMWFTHIFFLPLDSKLEVLVLKTNNRENKDKLSIGVKLLSNEEKARQTNMLKLRQSWDNNYWQRDVQTNRTKVWDIERKKQLNTRRWLFTVKLKKWFPPDGLHEGQKRT